MSKGQFGITGSTGFLGANLVAGFPNPESLVRIQRSEGKFQFPSSDLDVLFLTHGAIASGSDKLDEETLFSGNVKSTLQVCNAFPHAHIVFASTASISGFQGNPLNENSLSLPANGYAVSKLWAELVVSSQAHYSIVRFSSLYGNGMRENTIIPNYVNQALNKGEIEVWGKGSRRQNYLHIQDAAKIMVAASTVSYNKIFLGVDQFEYSNLDLAELIAQKTGAKIKFVGQDNSKSVSYNNRLTRDTLNWKPAISFEAGISQYIEWKKRQSSLPE
jgi:nucleoside-diphosphate-sugar epimerase